MPGREMRVSRRDFLKTGLTLGAGGLLGGGLLSGCGTGNTVKAFTTSTAGKPRRGGTLRAGLTGGSSADTLDPLNAITNVDFSRIDNLYEPLVGLTPDAQPVFVLAEELTPNAKATEWTLRSASGITFHNGKDLTADDGIYTFRQILNPKAPAAPRVRPVLRKSLRLTLISFPGMSTPGCREAVAAMNPDAAVS